MNSLENIRKRLEKIVGKRIKVKVYKGRKKRIERVGILEELYPRVFVVRLENQQGRTSYCYADILTKVVEVTPF